MQYVALHIKVFNSTAWCEYIRNDFFHEKEMHKEIYPLINQLQEWYIWHQQSFTYLIQLILSHKNSWLCCFYCVCVCMHARVRVARACV